MADFWKSTPKYWCKHCSTHVKDTPFERKQHESTGRHQGNLKRFLRDIQNSHEKDEREKQKAKAEVDRLNKQFGGTQSTSQLATNPTSQASASQKPQATVADRQRQMTQLAEMGIEIPEDQRRDLGLAGGWQTVSRRVLEDEQPPSKDTLSVGVHKRKYEGQDEEEEAGETVVRRGWGSTTKRYPGEPLQDLEALLATHKIIKTENITAGKQPNMDSSPKEQTKTEKDGFVEQRLSTAQTKEEEPLQDLADIPETNSVMPIPVFKKRKPKGGPT